MTRKVIQDPKTGLIKQPLGRVVLGGVFVFVILIVTSTIFPYFLNHYLYISILVGMFGFASLVWINIRPNLYARFLQNICISILCLIIAFRAFDNLLPRFSYHGAALIVAIATFAHTLPMWNPKVARFIRDELSAPKTKMGKVVFRISLALIPFVGILAAIMESFLYSENKFVGLSFVLIFLGLLVAIVLPFTYRFPSSPWEIQEK